MEEQEGSDDPKEGKEEIKAYRRRKPPDKHRHQMEMEYLTKLINEKEALYKSLNMPKIEKSGLCTNNREELLSKLRSLKDEKEKRMKRKQVIDAELKGLSQQLQKKTETCTKLQASLRYKDEQRTNDAIKRLERHLLSTHQLKLCEEKKLVSEIDALKRSKKNLSEYLCIKQDVDQLRQSQRKLRDERDTLIRETHDIKAKEKHVKDALDELKTLTQEDAEDNGPACDKEMLKKEIDSLYEKRREVHGLFKQEMVNYYEEKKQIERDLTKNRAEEKREEMRISKMTSSRHRQKIRQEAVPFEEEKNICACLIQYLEPFKIQASGEPDDVKTAGQAKYLEDPKMESNRDENTRQGAFVVKKGNEDLSGLFAVSSRKMGRKGSRKGRKSKDSGQKLVLHPHVFEQLFRLNLDPPLTHADVDRILKQLNNKKEFYEKSAQTTSQQSLLFSENSVADQSQEATVGLDVTEAARGTNAKAGTQEDTCGTPKEQELEAPETGAKSSEAGSSPTLGISRTDEDSSGDERRVGTGGIEELIENEKVNIKNENSSAETTHVTQENETKVADREETEEKDYCRNQEKCKEILKDTCVKHSTVITDTLEKGLHSLGIKESSKEIQVRVT